MKMTRWLVKEKQSVRTFCLAATWKVQKSAFQASFHCFVINPQLAPAFGCQFPSFVLAKAPVQQLCGYGLLYHGSHYVRRSIFVRKLSTNPNNLYMYQIDKVKIKGDLEELIEVTSGVQCPLATSTDYINVVLLASEFLDKKWVWA